MPGNDQPGRAWSHIVHAAGPLPGSREQAWNGRVRAAAGSRHQCHRPACQVRRYADDDTCAYKITAEIGTGHSIRTVKQLKHSDPSLRRLSCGQQVYTTSKGPVSFRFTPQSWPVETRFSGMRQFWRGWSLLDFASFEEGGPQSPYTATKTTRALSRISTSLARCPCKTRASQIYLAAASRSETMTICMSLARPMILCTGSRDKAGSADHPRGLVTKICVT